MSFFEVWSCISEDVLGTAGVTPGFRGTGESVALGEDRRGWSGVSACGEACEAYVLSQAGEGWEAIKTHYDDGGFSGGNMERPALQKLLTDIGAGKVDVIVVYKVDRLTRSLADFAKIVEIFDGKGVSFVSVTQAFNTTTSMGRLTLNVLLSFAQFEREVTGERIRDKFAASLKKGMWMGGNPPLGYDIADRKLVVNDAEADTVRDIFNRYLELRSVPALTEELATKGIRTKHWRSASGRALGNNRFSRGALYHLLRNRVYIGEVIHKEKSYPGLHESIISLAVWERTQELLTSNAGDHWKRVSRSNTDSPLKGLLFDDRGNLMSPSFTSKKRGRYRYYVSQALLQHRKRDAGSIARIPAVETEKAIEKMLSSLLPTVITGMGARPYLERLGVLLPTIVRIIAEPDRVTFVFNSDCVRMIDRATLKSMSGTRSNLDGEAAVTVPVRWITRGGERMLLTAALEKVRPSEKLDPTLVKALARAWRWRRIFESGNVTSIPELAERESLNENYIKKLLKLAFLPPVEIESILNGGASRKLTLASLLSNGPDVRWDQRTRV